MTAGSVYVPTYSHIYVSEGEAVDLATTLSIRNLSHVAPVILTSARYYDTAGKLIEEYLPDGVSVGPLETVEFFVATGDRRGGSGSNFLITWTSVEPVAAPLVESIMVRHDRGTRSFAFVSRGVEVPRSTSDAQPEEADGPE